MLTQGFTHKSHKITTLNTDSYKQLFVLITMLLTVLSVRPLTFAMAAPSQPTQQYQVTQTHTQHNLPHDTIHHTHLQEILLAERKRYQYDNHHHNHYYHHNYIYNNYYQLQQAEQRQLQHEQAGTDLRVYEDGDEEERLHKRAISWHDYYNTIMQSQAINWYNPCGGISQMVGKPARRRRRPPIKKELRKLQNTIAKNFNLIKGTLHVINIRNMKQWDLTEKYSFLPKLNTNSTISLRRWHRQLQIYVAAFEYLRRAQLYFDYVRDSQESSLARELNELMKDARNMLCNIEHAINNTTTGKSAATIDSLFISRTKMEDILKFTTNIKYISPLKWHQIKTDNKSWLVDVFDLRFSKSQYYAFIRKLMKILRIHTKRPGPIYLGKGGNKIQSETKENSKRQQKKIKRHRRSHLE